MKNSHIIIVFYDISSSAKEYRRLKKTLDRLGYYPIQKSVYGCKIYERSVVDLHIKEIERVQPQDCNIRILTLTKEQFLSMKFLGSDETIYEKMLVHDDIIINL